MGLGWLASSQCWWTPAIGNCCTSEQRLPCLCCRDACIVCCRAAGVTIGSVAAAHKYASQMLQVAYGVASPSCRCGPVPGAERGCRAQGSTGADSRPAGAAQRPGGAVPQGSCRCCPPSLCDLFRVRVAVQLFQLLPVLVRCRGEGIDHAAHNYLLHRLAPAGNLTFFWHTRRNWESPVHAAGECSACSGRPAGAGLAGMEGGGAETHCCSGGLPPSCCPAAGLCTAHHAHPVQAHGCCCRLSSRTIALSCSGVTADDGLHPCLSPGPTLQHTAGRLWWTGKACTAGRRARRRPSCTSMDRRSWLHRRASCSFSPLCLAVLMPVRPTLRHS